MTTEVMHCDQVLTPHEAAELLQMPEAELLDRARRRAVPGVCLGGVWRFSRLKITQEIDMGLR